MAHTEAQLTVPFDIINIQLYHPHDHHVNILLKIILLGSGKMAQWFRALAEVPEDPGLV